MGVEGEQVAAAVRQAAGSVSVDVESPVPPRASETATSVVGPLRAGGPTAWQICPCVSSLPVGAFALVRSLGGKWGNSDGS